MLCLCARRRFQEKKPKRSERTAVIRFNLRFKYRGGKKRKYSHHKSLVNKEGKREQKNSKVSSSRTELERN